jgi:hypothetical protein
MVRPTPAFEHDFQTLQLQPTLQSLAASRITSNLAMTGSRTKLEYMDRSMGLAYTLERKFLQIRFFDFSQRGSRKIFKPKDVLWDLIRC